MDLHIYLIAVLLVGGVGLIAYQIITRRAVDVELEAFKRSRKVWTPDDMFHTSMVNLQLCVSCEEIHTSISCPKCGSEVAIPLRRIVRSTIGLELPLKKSTKPDNVIELPVNTRAV